MHDFKRSAAFLGCYTFQAHRGGLEEVPENTLESMFYAWQFSGAIPETDVRTLADGTLVCVHDETLERTADGPPSVLTTAVSHLVRRDLVAVDVGIKRSRRFQNCRVPRLEEIFALMQGSPHRRLYLEIKDASLECVFRLIDQYKIINQVIFVHEDEAFCRTIQKSLPEARTMTWCSGSPQCIEERFLMLHAGGFPGLSQVQIHVPDFATEDKTLTGLPVGFIQRALEMTREATVDLQVYPLQANPNILRLLLDMGIRWFVTDAPLRFIRTVNAAVFSDKPAVIEPRQEFLDGLAAGSLR